MEIAIGVLVVAGIVALAAYGARNSTFVLKKRWASVAETLEMGLGRYAPPGSGPRDEVMFRDRGVPVFVYTELFPARKGSTYETHVVAAIDPPLAMRLGIVPSTIRDDLLGAGDDIRVGDDAFDGVYTVRGIDPEQTRRVAGSIARECVRRDLGAWTIRVTDTAVRLHVPTLAADLETLRPAVEAAENIAKALIAARANAPEAPWERDALAAMDMVATATGLTLDRRRLRLEGKLGTVDVAVRIEVGDHDMTTHVESRFEQPLGIALQVVPQSATATVLSWIGATEDIRVGDEAFDKELVVKGRPVDVVKQVLDQPVRDRLRVMLAHALDVKVTDDGVHLVLKGTPTEPDVLRNAIDDVADVTRRLASWGGTSQGAYR